VNQVGCAEGEQRHLTDGTVAETSIRDDDCENAQGSERRSIIVNAQDRRVKINLPSGSPPAKGASSHMSNGPSLRSPVLGPLCSSTKSGSSSTSLGSTSKKSASLFCLGDSNATADPPGLFGAPTNSPDPASGFGGSGAVSFGANASGFSLFGLPAPTNGKQKKGSQHKLFA
jgi:hypothetical protein